MQRNDYRRAVILLRAMLAGYAGHARLERRTLTANLNVTATAPLSAGSLPVSFVGTRNGSWYAVPIGELRRDSRGQAYLAYRFDPRDVGGRPLEAYSLLVVADVDRSGGCRLALTGNLGGSVRVDWGAVQSAVCALYEDCPTDSVTGLPTCERSPLIQPRGPEEDSGVSPARAERAAAEDSEAPAGGEADAPEGADTDSDPDAVGGEDTAQGADPDRWFDPPEEADTARDAADEPDGEGAADEPESARAGDAENPLPDCACDTANCLLPELEGYIFERIGVPLGCGYDCAAIGLRVQDNAISSVCFALPARRTALPPPGLEDYRWLGEGAGGWWIHCIDTN